MKKAFTLIELLVVIAIIAILAAILFPVFAQAKVAAKKAASLSNIKQTATGLIIYTADSDDTFPLAYAFDANGTMLMGPTGPDPYHLASVPAGWGVNAPNKQEDSVMWVNSTSPYLKNYEITNHAFSKLYTSGFDYSTAPGSLPVVSASMNGLLNGYNTTGAASSSTLPLIDWGNGTEAYRGYAYVVPIMRCDAVGTPAAPAPPCLFNPSGTPQSGMTRPLSRRMDTQEYTFDPGNDTSQVTGDGWTMSFADTSAKFLKSPAEGTNNGNYNQPGYIYTKGYNASRGGTTPPGYIDTPLRCQAGTAGTYYMSFYRPDTNRSYDFGGTGSGAQCNK